MNQSLIIAAQDAAATAPFLFSEDDLASIKIEEKAGRFTGERLFVQRPETYKATVHLLAQGIGVHRIAAMLNVSHHTVSAVRDREQITIATQKEELGARCLSAARVCLDRLIEEVDTLKPEALAVAVGILVDKGQLLTGGATQRVSTVNEPGLDAFKQFLEGLPRANAQEIGFQAGTLEQSAPVVPAPGVAALPVVSSDTVDSESSAFPPSPSVNPPAYTENSTDHDQPPGGEGV